jgi:hypothetical protein
MTSSASLWGILYGGIRADIPGHGGAECAAYLSKNTMIFETLLSTSMMIAVGIFGFFTYTMPQIIQSEKCSSLKKVLLILLCLVFGVEFGYKLCSRQVLYLLNPCHIITVIEVRRIEGLHCLLLPWQWW